MSSSTFEAGLVSLNHPLCQLNDFHGKKKETRSGVAIALGPRALQSWRLAGRPDPIRITCAKAGRIIALPLRITQKKNKKSSELNYLFISVHFPHTGYENTEFADTCNDLSKLLDRSPTTSSPLSEQT